MPSSTGLLTQAIVNLQGMSQHLAALGGLPDNARGIETSIVNLLQGEIPKVKNVQSTVQGFVSASLPGLQQAKTDLDNGTNQEGVAAAITQVSTSALTQKQTIDALNADINRTKASIVELLTHSLAPIEGQLNAQSITLTTQLQSAQQEADEIHSKELYFLALGVLGLIGLAAAGIAMAVQQSKVNGLLAQVSDLRAQVANLGMLKQSVNLVITDLGDVINQVSNVNNAVAFVAGDTAQIINDLKNADGSRTKIYLLTTIGQLQTLGNDAA